MISNDEEIRLSYLLSSSFDVLPFSYHKLRSYLNIHISNIADQHNLKLRSFSNRNKICPYCYTSWSGETTTFKLLPSKKYKLRLQKNNYEEGINKAKLNELRNTLVLKCKVCTKKSLFSLTKKKPATERKSEITKCGKKKKKRKDKSCGLTVNIKQPDNFLPEIIVLKKKKWMKNTEKTRFTNPAYSPSDQSELQNFTPISKIKINTNCKKLAPNPFAVESHNKFSRKNDKKLERLKEAIKNNKAKARKSLKDFLTLV